MAPEQAKGKRGGQARRHLGLRVRAVRDAHRAEDLRWGGRDRHAHRGPARQPGLVGPARSTPPEIRTLLRRCLEKDPRKRAGDISIARLEIDEALTAASTQDSSRALTPAVAHHAHWRERLAWSLATALALAAGWIALKPAPPREPPAPAGRFAIEIPWTSEIGGAAFISVSPDGTAIAVQSSNTAGPAPFTCDGWTARSSPRFPAAIASACRRGRPMAPHC